MNEYRERPHYFSQQFENFHAHKNGIVRGTCCVNSLNISDFNFLHFDFSLIAKPTERVLNWNCVLVGFEKRSFPIF